MTNNIMPGKSEPEYTKCNGCKKLVNYYEYQKESGRYVCVECIEKGIKE